MNFNEYEFRCHALGHIMTNPKGKSNLQKYQEAEEAYDLAREKYRNLANKGTKTAENLLEKLNKLGNKIKFLESVKNVPYLSDSCKTHLCDLHTVIKYGRTRDVKNKYLEKGLLLEEDAITLVSLFTGQFFKKNEERRSNGFICGEADIEDECLIWDTKVSWDIFTFRRTIPKAIDPVYHWQLDGYMWLWDKPKARLAYTLINTPEHLIKLEEKRLLNDFVGTEEDYKDACADLRKNMIYDDIPLEEKVVIFEVERNATREEAIKKRVMECRQFLNSLENLETLKFEEYEDTGEEVAA